MDIKGLDLSVKDISNQVNTFTAEQIIALISKISIEKDPHALEKARTVFSKLEERDQLEALGKGIQFPMALDLLTWYPEMEQTETWKLSPVMVGMSHHVFWDLLRHSSEDQLNTLKHEGVTEPVQHQLTLAGHEVKGKIQSLCKEIDQFEESLNTSFIEVGNRYTWEKWTNTAEQLRGNLHHLIELIDRTLAIAWHTNRIHLIETLSQDKEIAQRYLSQVIGFPRIGDQEEPTGIYALIDERLKDIFGNPSEIEAALDDEPAIEGLTKLSIWYLVDYWRLGLLPNILDEKMLRLDATQNTDDECLKYRGELFQQVLENLECLGLNTVKDLKNSGIYSKETLLEFIQENQNKLS